MKKSLILTLLVLLIQTSLVFADDWPEFRGYSRTGISAETELLTSWPEAGPELLWTATGLGVGWASVSIVDDIAYTAGMDRDSKQGSVFAFDKDGKQLWKTTYGPEWTQSYPGARNTPTYSNGRLYMNSGLSQVVCLDAKSGKIVWSVEAGKIYQGQTGRWGASDSVLVYDGLAIVTPGGKLASVVALDAESGKEVWKTSDYTESAVHCSPVIVSHNGLDMVIAVMNESIAAIEAKTGKVIWKVAHAAYEPQGRAAGARANSPIYCDGKIFVSSGYEKGAVMLQLSEDGRSAKIVGSLAEFDSHFGGVVKVGNHVYGTNTDRPNKWVSMNWDDCKFTYTHDWGGNKGSLIAAEGMLYCYGEQNGTIALVKADPTEFKIISQFKVPAGTGEHWAHLAISNGRLYVHRGDALMVYKIKQFVIVHGKGRKVARM